MTELQQRTMIIVQVDGLSMETSGMQCRLVTGSDWRRWNYWHKNPRSRLSLSYALFFLSQPSRTIVMLSCPAANAGMTFVCPEASRPFTPSSPQPKSLDAFARCYRPVDKLLRLFHPLDVLRNASSKKEVPMAGHALMPNLMPCTTFQKGKRNSTTALNIRLLWIIRVIVKSQNTTQASV